MPIDPQASPTSTSSLAVAQRSLGDPARSFPLTPPLTRGCPATSTPDLAYPLEVDYDYARADPGMFAGPASPGPGPDLARWAPLLPPLTAPTLGEGGTPLLDLGDGVLIKDESRNPTWSHKDRLNRVTVSAALTIGAPGVVVASSGNHAAAAAAFAARAGLPCVVLASAESPPAVQSFARAYGATVLTVPAATRWPLTNRIVDELGFHPVSNLTVTHTGHPYGAEGYKSIAYELHAQLGRAPAAVFVPTGYAELLYGVWKGFRELRDLGVTETAPRMFACEPAVGGPHHHALERGLPAAIVPHEGTRAYGIGVTVGGHRGVRAVRESGGRVLLLTDVEMADAQRELANAGLWQELAGAAGLAGLRRSGEEFDGPVVCVATSSGFKDVGVGEEPVRLLDGDWETVRALLPRT